MNRRFILSGWFMLTERVVCSKRQAVSGWARGLQFLLKLLRKFPGAKTARLRLFVPVVFASLRSLHKNRCPRSGEAAPADFNWRGAAPPSLPGAFALVRKSWGGFLWARNCVKFAENLLFWLIRGLKTEAVRHIMKGSAQRAISHLRRFSERLPFGVFRGEDARGGKNIFKEETPWQLFP